MKKLLRKFVLAQLKGFAKRRLKNFKGKTVAVTGSVGKTSTKDAIFAVLNSQYSVMRNNKSMNSEFGLLLTILDIESGFSSALKWSWLLALAWLHSFSKIHSDVLLFELGVDKKGDMDYLLSIIKPDIAVFTNVAPVHMDEGQFSTLEDIYNEKRKLVDALAEKGVAILNMDNEFTAELARKIKKKTIGYGLSKEGDYYATNISETLEGIHFILHNDGKKYEVSSKILGKYHAQVFMPAVICGQLIGMPIEQAIEALGRYELPPGRMSLIPGIEETTMIDSSYNSSPEALKEALKSLRDLGEKSRRVAVLGNMNELGQHSQILHERVGALIPDCADLLITIGSDAKFFASEAIEKGMDEKQVHTFNNTPEAIEFFKEEIKKGDLILVKGSQNRVRLERFVKEFMANPEDAKKVLVRQEKVWSKI